MTMPATGTPPPTFDIAHHPQVSLRDYLVADPDSPVESPEWLAFQAAADHEQAAARLARAAH
jgi:hypothetical protein